MREITVTFNVCTYNELSEEAKKKAKEEYLDDSFRGETFTEMCQDVIEEKFPLSNLAVQWSLSSCQGDGVNIYGELDLNDILKIDSDPDSWSGNGQRMFTEKDRKTIIAYADEIGWKLKLPMNRRYCYCVADQIDFIGDMEYDLVCAGYRDIKKDVLEKLHVFVVKIIKSMCNALEEIGYEYLYTVEDEEISEISEANGWEYLEDGSFFAN